MAPKIDLTGRVFGKLTVMVRGHQKGYRTYWQCQCACGRETTVRIDHLMSGGSTTCGCGIRAGLLRANTTHGKTRTPEYRTWAAIQTRCYNDKEKTWPHYGGRGITVCERWRGEGGFENFLADMGERPSSAHSIERKKVNLHYSPDNCIWATRPEQMLNRRNTLRVQHNGKLIPLKTACELEGMNYYSVRSRIIRGHEPFVRLRG